MALTSAHLLSLTFESNEWRSTPRAATPIPTSSSRSAPPARRIEQIETAKAVCRQCQAQSACLEFALATNQDSGIWGGTSEEERRKLPQGVRWPASAAPPEPRSERIPRPPASGGRFASGPIASSRGGVEVGGQPQLDDGAGPLAVGGSNMSIVPSSSVVTSARTIDRPRPWSRLDVKPSGRPDAVVDRRRTTSSWPSLASSTRTWPPSASAVAARREGVVDRVLQQLGEHDGQRRGDRRRQRAGVARDLEVDRAVGRDTRLLHHPHQRPQDLDERHVLARLARQRLVHEGDRADAPHRLLDRRLGLGGLEAPALQPQQRRDRLQVVLHPVVDLADGGVLRQQQPVTTAHLGDVAQQHHRAGDARLASSSGMQRTSTVTCRPRSISSVTGAAMANGGADRLVLEADLAEAHALGVGVHADAVQGRHRVRATRTRRSPTRSSRITPSPTRGASSLGAVLAGERELRRWRSSGRSG